METEERRLKGVCWASRRTKMNDDGGNAGTVANGLFDEDGERPPAASVGAPGEHDVVRSVSGGGETRESSRVRAEVPIPESMLSQANRSTARSGTDDIRFL
jgi:hypothetical protein